MAQHVLQTCQERSPTRRANTPCVRDTVVGRLGPAKASEAASLHDEMACHPLTHSKLPVCLALSARRSCTECNLQLLQGASWHALQGLVKEARPTNNMYRHALLQSAGIKTNTQSNTQSTKSSEQHHPAAKCGTHSSPLPRQAAESSARCAGTTPHSHNTQGAAKLAASDRCERPANRK